MNRLRCIAVFVGLSAVSAMSLAAQGRKADPDLILQLSREAASAATRALTSDESAKSSVDRAAMALVARGDLNSALQTAIALAHDPQFRTKYRELSRDIACYLLEDRKIDAAIEAAGTLATSDAFSGDWTTAHMAASLLNLPRPLRPSLKDAPVDTVSLVRRAFSIASSVKDPEAATDLYVTISASLQRRDSRRARIAVRAADSTRRLIRDRDRFTSRQAIVAAQAVAVADWALASNIADSIRDRGDIQFVLFRLRAGRDSADSLNKSRNALRAKLQHRLEATPEARAKSIPVNPVDIDDETDDPVIAAAVRALRRSDLEQTEKALDRIPDSLNLGLKPIALQQIADSALTPEMSAQVRQRALALLTSSRAYALRDELLGEIAAERLVNGYNEEAIDIVNTINDVQIARETLRDIGQSTMANLDPPKLRKLVDRIRVRAVKDQVLYRLMISMLLSERGPEAHNRWGIALLDSIQTPELRAKAKVAVARFFFFKHDSVASRRLFLEMLPRDLGMLDQYERSTVVNLLAALGADSDLLRWARSMPESKKKADALLSLAGQFALRLPRSADGRQFVVSNGGDSCRERF